eukprot:tig00021127_g18790.t1
MGRLTPAFVFLLAIPLSALGLLVPRVESQQTQRQILYCFVVSILAFFGTLRLIPVIAVYTKKAGLAGRDINKAAPKKSDDAASSDGPAEDARIPESLGLVCATVYIVATIVLQLFMVIPESALDEYNAGLTSVLLMTLLGFADDVLDLPWRYKIILPAFATLPLLVTYSGSTTVLVPRPLHPFLGASLALGVLYKVYMGFLAIFCNQSINIYAGINGLEAGQSYIIGCAVLIHNLLNLDSEFFFQHLFSIFLILPFIAVTLGLLYYNWYPSAVFVGDTFCYFAGIALAVVGILAHFSELLAFFFLPQILNFLYSLPQLFKLVPCPRHRVPKLNPTTGKLESSKNYTLLNAFLGTFGPMTERNLCVALLVFQALCCAGALLAKHYVVSALYA